MEQKDILLEAEIPKEYVEFFWAYQRYLEKKSKGIWYYEKNGRFASNFRYCILEGLKKDIKEGDLLLAAAILLSHCESYFEYLFNPSFKNTSNYEHELGNIKKITREIAEFMAKSDDAIYEYASPETSFSKTKSLLGFTNEELKVPARDTDIKKVPGRYLRFFCNLPEIWDYKPKNF